MATAIIRTFDQAEDEFLMVFAVCEHGPVREEMMLKLREYHLDGIEMKIKEGDPSNEFFVNLDQNRELVRNLEQQLLFWVFEKELHSRNRNAPGLYS